MREAPSRVLMEGLWSRGAVVIAYDPVAMPETKRIYGNHDKLHFAENSHAALADADALLIVTEWKAFRTPDFQKLKSQLKHPIIFDGRNLYDPKEVRSHGIEYFAIGRV